MTPEHQKEYDALAWVWRTWLEDDDFETGGYQCVRCAEWFMVGDEIAEKDTSPDYWHAKCAPPQAIWARDRIKAPKWPPHMPWPSELIDTVSVREGYPALAEKIAHLIPRIDEMDVVMIVNLVIGTCRGCYADNRDCQCWNDE